MIDQVAVDGVELAYMMVIVLVYTAIIASLAYSFAGGGNRPSRPAAAPLKWDEILGPQSEKAVVAEPIRRKLEEFTCPTCNHCQVRRVEGVEQPLGVLFGMDGKPVKTQLRIAEGTWPESVDDPPTN